MAKILREKMSRANTEIRELTIKKELIEEKIQMQKSFISDLDKTGQNKITEIKVKIDTLFDSSSLMSEMKKLQQI